MHRNNIGRTILLASLLLALTATGWAQVPSSGNVFFGYSYFNTNLFGNRTSANGWEASFEGKIVPFLGMVADFDGHYSGTVNFPESDCSGIACPVGPANGGIPQPGGYLSANMLEYDFLFGPRVSIPAGRFRPFGEFLIGGAHMNAKATGTNSSFGTDNSFATAVGGGFDYRIIRPIAWRLQGDYIHTNLFGTGENDVRISTGIVLRF